MSKLKRTNIIRSILLILILISPLFGLSQSRDTHVRKLNREIARLSGMIENLQAEQARSLRIEKELSFHSTEFTTRDSLNLVNLQKKQAESRAKINRITIDIIAISKQLKDPNKLNALAKKMQQPQPKQTATEPEAKLDSVVTPKVVNARSIDLIAVKLVRHGKSLDQARLITIDALSDAQVRTFYQNLDKADRYELYDIADEIVASDMVELVDARRSAIYFHLFTK